MKGRGPVTSMELSKQRTDPPPWRANKHSRERKLKTQTNSNSMLKLCVMLYPNKRAAAGLAAALLRRIGMPEVSRLSCE